MQQRHRGICSQVKLYGKVPITCTQRPQSADVNKHNDQSTNIKRWLVVVSAKQDRKQETKYDHKNILLSKSKVCFSNPVQNIVLSLCIFNIKIFMNNHKYSTDTFPNYMNF